MGEHTAVHDEREPAIGELYSVLVSPHRRQILRSFMDREENDATLGELVAHLVGRGGDFSDQNAANVTLHHASLPKLVESGVIVYDPQSNVARNRGYSQLEALLLEETTELSGVLQAGRLATIVEVTGEGRPECGDPSFEDASTREGRTVPPGAGCALCIQ